RQDKRIPLYGLHSVRPCSSFTLSHFDASSIYTSHEVSSKARSGFAFSLASRGLHSNSMLSTIFSTKDLELMGRAP
ncbi:hypothetical protein HAX54_029514, partial [Datura stramonium]|nr:hypothetical protein [Datura stramonium]